MRRARLRLTVVAAVLWSACYVGCARRPEPVYVAGPWTEKLPESHQKQMRERLAELFGTPSRPRWMTAAEGGQEPGKEEPGKLVPVVDERRLQEGAVLFRRHCAGCHGVSGDGAGEAAAYLQPRPRDYRQGIFKFTSAPYGMKPLRRDLVRVVRQGAKGTSMPAFPFLPADDVQRLVDYVMYLSQRGEVERSVAQLAETEYEPEDSLAPEDFGDALDRVQRLWRDAESRIVHVLSAPIPSDDDSIVKGRTAFLTRGCAKCHGEDNRGQTDWLSHEFLAEQAALPEERRTKINFDAWQQAAPAADLTAGMLHGGRRPIDIYRRIASGINGTPMPGFAQALAQEPETIWHLVNYVLAVVEHRPMPENAPKTEAEAQAAMKPAGAE